MEKDKILSEIQNYLQTRGWTKKHSVYHEVYEKKYCSEVPLMRSFISANRICDIVEKRIQIDIHQETHYNSVVNMYNDTDFIIASLQSVNPYLYGKLAPEIGIRYSFQPVVRPVPKEEIGNDGFLKSFVNVGTVGIVQDYKAFFEQLELWLDVLSLCRIHISRIQLETKTTTTAYDGVGLAINVNGYDIGQANIYQMNIGTSDYYVLDFGFGLERIAWAANSFKDFSLVVQNYSLYYLEQPHVTDSVKYIVLLMLSGIAPSAKKYGLILRNEMMDLFEKQGYLFDFKKFIDFAYNYYSRFISSSITKTQIENIFEAEKEYLLKKSIARRNNHIKQVNDVELESLCERIYKNKQGNS